MREHTAALAAGQFTATTGATGPVDGLLTPLILKVTGSASPLMWNPGTLRLSWYRPIYPGVRPLQSSIISAWTQLGSPKNTWTFPVTASGLLGEGFPAVTLPPVV